jgi:hypothetical protein
MENGFPVGSLVRKRPAETDQQQGMRRGGAPFVRRCQVPKCPGAQCKVPGASCPLPIVKLVFVPSACGRVWDRLRRIRITHSPHPSSPPSLITQRNLLFLFLLVHIVHALHGEYNPIPFARWKSGDGNGDGDGRWAIGIESGSRAVPGCPSLEC